MSIFQDHLHNDPTEGFLPASRVLHTWPAGPKITLRFPRLYVRPHLSRAQ